jgi:hypothetical protein
LPVVTDYQVLNLLNRYFSDFLSHPLQRIEFDEKEELGYLSLYRNKWVPKICSLNEDSLFERDGDIDTERTGGLAPLLLTRCLFIVSGRDLESLGLVEKE